MTGMSENSASSLIGSAIGQSPLSIVLTDPRLDDNPITYVNEAFFRTTQYSRDFALGRNCRFLQGPDTRPEDVQALREGLQSQTQFELTITNHKADGSPFLNHLLISPVRDDEGDVVAFFGLQRELDAERAAAARSEANKLRDSATEMLRELQHRVKNHLAMVVSMIRMQARRDVTADSFTALSRRIEALALLYEELFKLNLDGARDRKIDAGAYLGRIASVLSGIEGRDGVKVDVRCDPIELSVDQAARCGLLLSELVTNALEHAFSARDTGTIEVVWTMASGDGDRVRLKVEDDGVGLPVGSNWPWSADSLDAQRAKAARSDGTLDTTGAPADPGVGGSIVSALARSMEAEITVEPGANGGTSVEVVFEREG
ncbi:sensory box histidine kinase [Roseivivax marinus]|uniref:histidine kinase n=1 Tax=Roseivivax marinus TaxID=1379903 RepID=W4HIR5_9RHOB|nr:PAS domain-containing protein [Roseivivax marinus]ETW12599.1 sensory box histidine kinase [Roseivivax marinus]SEL15768.1 PAS domain S-box-containing protein [Roseivivax marinus]